MSASAKQAATIASLKGTLKAMQRRDQAATKRRFAASRRPGNSSAGPSSSSATFPGGSSFDNKRPYTLENDEFIVNVDSSLKFKVSSYSVNPGQSALFPWLSVMAKNYEKYSFEYLEFYFRPRVSGYAAAGQRGQVIMSFDYDASDVPPTSKQQMEATHPHTDDMPYKEQRLKLSPNDLTPKEGKFVRPGLQPTNTDIKTYDAGLLHVATEGMEVEAFIGELRVRYKVHLRVPVMEALDNFKPSKFIAVAHGHNDGVTGNFYLDHVSGSEPISPNNLSLVANDDGSIGLPTGQYWIDVNVNFNTVDSSPLTTIILSQILPGPALEQHYTKQKLEVQSAGITGNTLAGRFLFTSRSDDPTQYTNKFQLDCSLTGNADVITTTMITLL